MAKKFLDANGVQYLWSKISLQDYPNNETLINVINAIDETKADRSELSSFVSVEPQELTDEQKAQARANIDKYIWHTHKSLLRECLYAIDTKYPVDFNLAQNILNATNNGNLNALEDIIDLLSWYINATSFPENDSNSLVSSIVQNYEALKNGGALLSSGNYLSIYVSIASDNYINTHIKIYPISKGQYGTHRIEWKRDIDDFYAQWNYNINTNTTVEDKINRRYADKTLTQVGFYADAKAVGDALVLKADKADIVQPDWSQTDETAKDFIRNKPNEYDALELVAEMGLVSPTAAKDGAIFTDENGNIYSL